MPQGQHASLYNATVSSHLGFRDAELDGGEGSAHPRPLSACEVWIGSSSAAHEVSARLDDLDEAALLQRDGIAVVYIPLMPNDRRVPDFDPFSISTWRREVSPDESQKLLDVAEVRAAAVLTGVSM